MMSRSDKNEECIICLEEMVTENKEVLPCGHIFHKECLVKQFQATCALCRKPFARVPLIEEFVPVTDEYLQRRQTNFRSGRGLHLQNTLRRVHAMIGNMDTIIGNVGANINND